MAVTTTTLVVTHDDTLVSERFLAQHLLELEGVETVRED